MNWLIAPAFANTGRVVTLSPFKGSRVPRCELSKRGTCRASKRPELGAHGGFPPRRAPLGSFTGSPPLPFLHADNLARLRRRPRRLKRGTPDRSGTSPAPRGTAARWASGSSSPSGQRARFFL